MRSPRSFVHVIGLLAGAALSLGWPPRRAQAAGSTVVESWVRPPGDAADAEDPTVKHTRIDVASLPQTEVELVDPQYGKKLRFRGAPLAALIEKIAPPPGTDLALLHFGNGMAVPLPFRDRAVMERLRPFIACAVRGPQDASFTTEFQPLTRKVREYVDVPGTRFSGNKIVVAEAWHPFATAAPSEFSPWAHTDALVAVELVAASAYYRQFDVDRSPDVQAGLTLFRQTCQFCHGARRVGANFGWDFVEPVPLYTYRSGQKQLYYHVHYRRLDAPEHGDNMPALKFMTEADAGRLWKWLKAIGSKPMPAYQPAR